MTGWIHGYLVSFLTTSTHLCPRYLCMLYVGTPHNAFPLPCTASCRLLWMEFIFFLSSSKVIRHFFLLPQVVIPFSETQFQTLIWSRTMLSRHVGCWFLCFCITLRVISFFVWMENGDVCGLICTIITTRLPWCPQYVLIITDAVTSGPYSAVDSSR